MQYIGELTDDGLKEMKRKKLKKRLAVTGIILAAVFAALFAAYKIFMTPSRVVQLSLLNTGKELTGSFSYLTDDESVGIISRVLTAGGETKMNMKLEKAAVLAGTSAEIKINSDGKTTVSETALNPFVKFETYKDDKEFLINVPLLPSGLSVPLENFSEDFDNSVFGGQIGINQNSEGNTAAAVIYAAAQTAGFYGKYSGELEDWITSLEFKSDGTDSVEVGGGSKNAKVYTAAVSSDKLKTLYGYAADYFAQIGNDEIKNIIEQSADGISNDCTVRVKVRYFKIREIDISFDDDNKWVIKLTGKDKPSYDIVFYKEGAEQEALRRVHTDSGSGTDTIIKGDKELLNISRDGDSMSLAAEYNGIRIKADAAGMKAENGTAEIDNASITLNDAVTLSGSVSMSPEHGSAEFERKSEYINLLELGEDKWKEISNIIISGIELMKGRF